MDEKTKDWIRAYVQTHQDNELAIIASLRADVANLLDKATACLEEGIKDEQYRQWWREIDRKNSRITWHKGALNALSNLKSCAI